MYRLARRLGVVGEFGRRVMLLAGGTALGRAIVILSSPLLTRLYTPEDYGFLAVYMAVVGILGSIVCLRYELAIPLPASERTAANLLVLSLMIIVLSALLAAVVIGLAGDAIARRLNLPEITPYLWFLPVGLVGVGCHQALSYWAIRKKAFSRIARTRVVQGFGQVGLQLGLGLGPGGPLGLLVGDLVGQAAGISTLATTTRGKDSRAFAGVRPHSLRAAMRRYWRFPIYSTGSALLDSSSRHLPAVLLAALYGPQIAGWYALGQRVVAMPMLLLGGAVGIVYLSEAATAAREDPDRLRRLLLRMSGRLLCLGALPFGIVGVTGPWLFAIMFGANWEVAGTYAQILALMYLAQFVVGPMSSTLNVIGRQDLHLLWDLFKMGLVLLLFGLGHTLAWTASAMLAAYGAGMLFCYVAFRLLGLVLLAPAENPSRSSEHRQSHKPESRTSHAYSDRFWHPARSHQVRPRNPRAAKHAGHRAAHLRDWTTPRDAG